MRRNVAGLCRGMRDGIALRRDGCLKHVVLLTGNALCTNPRVQKEAATLAQAGLYVTVLGGWYSPESRCEDLDLAAEARFRFQPVVDFTAPDARGRLASAAARLQTAVARRAHRWTGIETPWQLGYALSGMLRQSREVAADLYIAHSEVGLQVAWKLMREGCKVGIDMEDWFSEDLPPNALPGRPLKLLRKLEGAVLRGASYSSCPSAAMSRTLAERYGCRPPTVVYNAFPFKDRDSIDGLRKDRGDDRRPSVHWYSQTLGAGRGLEDLIGALPSLGSDVQLHFRGNDPSGYRERLLNQLPEGLRMQIHFHRPVDNAELLSRIAEHDIGFSGEDPAIPSRNLTVTNKVLHYLVAGLPVVASDTAGNREIAARASGAIWLWTAGDRASLATCCARLLREPGQLERAREAALASARANFSWERCAGGLLDFVQAALPSSSRGIDPTSSGEDIRA